MYKDIAKDLNKFIIQIPDTLVPVPTENDYGLGFIRRYFVQRTNDTDAFVFEVSKDVYEKLKINAFWKTLDMKWRIAGPMDAIYDSNGGVTDMGVKASNKATIGIASTTIKNISLYLPNLLQFYIK